MDPSEIQRVHGIGGSKFPRQCLGDIGTDRIRIALGAGLCQPIAAGLHGDFQQRELRVDRGIVEREELFPVTAKP